MTSKNELALLLSWWPKNSDATTVGDLGNYARRAWVRLDLGPDLQIVLNSDTTRAAVTTFLDKWRCRADDTWGVVAGTRGTINKVVYDRDGQPTPGWYAYTTKALAQPKQI